MYSRHNGYHPEIQRELLNDKRAIKDISMKVAEFFDNSMESFMSSDETKRKEEACVVFLCHAAKHRSVVMDTQFTGHYQSLGYEVNTKNLCEKGWTYGCTAHNAICNECTANHYFKGENSTGWASTVDNSESFYWVIKEGIDELIFSRFGRNTDLLWGSHSYEKPG